MNENYIKKYNNIINWGLLLFVVLNVFTNSIKILPNVFYYQFLLIIELTLVGYLFIYCRKIYINITDVCFIIFVAIIQSLSYIITFFIDGYYCFDIHRLLIFILMIVVLFYVPKYSYINKQYFENLLSGIIILGFLSCIYNIYSNWSIIKSFNIVNIMYYTSLFASFFNTRSNFCLLLCVSCAICLMRIKQKKKIYYLLLYFFFMNILLTNARTSIIVILGLIFIEFWKKCKNLLRGLIIFIFFVAVITFIEGNYFLSNFNDVINEYSLLFTRGDDFTNGRFELFEKAWNGTNIISFFIGHGIGSKDAYLTYIGSSIFSFHNMWIDIFFEGGILLLLIYIYFARYVILSLKISKLNHEVKVFFYNLFFIVSVSGFGDAIATPFLLDTSSIFSTIILFTCPICLLNGNNYQCDK